jgi:hypothetical protein
MAETTSAVVEKAKEAVEEVREHLERPTRLRVEQNTPEEINRQIRRDLRARVVYFAQRPEEIDRRLDELDHEWDIERLLQANAGIFSLVGLTFGAIHRRWYLLPLAASAFLVQHAVQGWCPPVSLFRRLGIRTAWEICHERYALKALRGDFGSVRPDDDPEERARQAIAAADMNL